MLIRSLMTSLDDFSLFSIVVTLEVKKLVLSLLTISISITLVVKKSLVVIKKKKNQVLLLN